MIHGRGFVFNSKCWTTELCPFILLPECARVFACELQRVGQVLLLLLHYYCLLNKVIASASTGRHQLVLAPEMMNFWSLCHPWLLVLTSLYLTKMISACPCPVSRLFFVAIIFGRYRLSTGFYNVDHCCC